MKKLALVTLLLFTTPLAPNKSTPTESSQDDRAKRMLSEYKNYGISFSADPNIGLIYDEQNPTLTFYFKNQNGDIKRRRYQASVESIGIKGSFCLKFNYAFIVGGDFNFENTQKPLNITGGIEFSLGSILGYAILIAYLGSRSALWGLASWLLIPCVTVAKIENAPGSYLVMCSFDAPFHFAASYVLGGTLTPISES